MRAVRYRRAAWAGAMVLAGIAATLAVLSSDRDAPDAREIVALAAGVDAADVRITRVRRDEGGRERRVEALLTNEGDQAVMVTYEAQSGLLRQVFWIGIGRGANEPGDTAVTLEQARLTAEKLMDRLFPDVPVMMDLTEAEKLADKPVYHFAWAATVQPDVHTGDQVSVLVSSTTGVPFSYTQSIARVRPSLDEIRIKRERAIELAAQAAERTWRQQFDRRVTVETTKARLVLSSVISPQYGPVWLVGQEVKDAETGDRLELASRAVDAMTGELLQ